MGDRITNPQLDDIADRIHDIFRFQSHLRIGDVLIKLSINSESTNSTQSIAIGIKELFIEQLNRLFKLWRITGAQSLVDSQQRIFMRDGGIFQNAGHRQHVVHRFHDFNGLQRRSANLFGR